MGTIIKAQRAFVATDSEKFKHIEVACGTAMQGEAVAGTDQAGTGPYAA
jgi:hypothetical protein